MIPPPPFRGTTPRASTCRGELRQSTPTSSCLPPGATRRVTSGASAQQQQISRRAVGVAVKLGTEPASVRLDKKPRRLITQAEQIRSRVHARRVDSAPARTLGVAV